MRTLLLRLTPAAIALLFAAACGIPPRGIGGADWTESRPEAFDTGPYLILGGPGQAFVAFRAELQQPPVVEWRLPAREKSPSVRVLAVRVDDLWVATLTGLPSGQEIAYRVHADGGSSLEYTFRAGVEPGQPFRFGVFGDTRTGHEVHRAVVEAINREDVDFVLHTGDMVDRGGVREQWDQFFQIERPLLTHAAILPSIGNHDLGARKYYRHYFLHARWAGDRRYYAKDWGNLRVIALDGGIECREGCTQYAYVERALADAVSHNMLTVMFLHFPPFSSGKHGSHYGVQGPITDLARRFGVELVIAGHDHDYERTVPIDGTTYVVSGSAGAPIRAVHPRWFTAHARTEPHYVLVDVEGNRMVLRAVNLNGQTFDRAVIDPVPPKPQ